ncbi:MAG: potassium transporter Trk [Betaproteobacteria bacterium HGW-Betaproteobacteria-13]|jgi:trk system potassium uptake protein TrkH|uniref:Trk system potassium uptake protein n=1 Tax=Parazoarcus communis TaxID=41977 RepID=A0A2U8H429_9RHOO|nr:potassium transporter TrkG [Parazoarcus communis]AWI79555.1 potassium transporter Trk [Parazoarcus communis]PKO79775.1 MAG: potassium transporter Trk [Betaproteobacteria bacterium HGW-Betaproteobacteria-13]
MRSYFPVIGALGLVLMLFGLVMAFPLAVSYFLSDGAVTAYDEALLVTFACGLLAWLTTRRRRRDLRVHDGFLLVAATWIVVPVFGAMPLMLYMPALSFTDAYFEAASGLTTTGATVLTGLEYLPISINLWRTFMHWVGGMGVIVLMVAVLPLLGIGGRQVFKAETPGPMKESGLTPRIAETAKGLWTVYALLTLACGLSLWWAGMKPWEAVIHAFSIMGLGGFSDRDASLGGFDSLPIELVTMGFALLSGVNFATHYLALVRRSPGAYLQDPEVPWFFGTLAVMIGALTVYLMQFHVYEDMPTTLRYVSFHAISLATSLGLATYDYTLWPMFAQICVLFLCSFAACSGSTGGGIKMMRAIILYKQSYREIVRSLHPSAVLPLRLGRQAVSEGVLHAVLAFSFMYMVTIVSLTLLLAATGLDLITAFSGVVACLNNAGPGLGEVGPASNYQGLSDLQTWILSFSMILGRLEIFTLLVVMTPTFWRR